MAKAQTPDEVLKRRKKYLALRLPILEAEIKEIKQTIAASRASSKSTASDGDARKKAKRDHFYFSARLTELTDEHKKLRAEVRSLKASKAS